MPQIEREASDSSCSAQPEGKAQRMISGFLLEKEPGE